MCNPMYSRPVDVQFCDVHGSHNPSASRPCDWLRQQRSLAIGYWVLTAVNCLIGSNVVHSDSKYYIDGINKSMQK